MALDHSADVKGRMKRDVGRLGGNRLEDDEEDEEGADHSAGGSALGVDEVFEKRSMNEKVQFLYSLRTLGVVSLFSEE